MKSQQNNSSSVSNQNLKQSKDNSNSAKKEQEKGSRTIQIKDFEDHTTQTIDNKKSSNIPNDFNNIYENQNQSKINLNQSQNICTYPMAQMNYEISQRTLPIISNNNYSRIIQNSASPFAYLQNSYNPDNIGCNTSQSPSMFFHNTNRTQPQFVLINNNKTNNEIINGEINQNNNFQIPSTNQNFFGNLIYFQPNYDYSAYLQNQNIVPNMNLMPNLPRIQNQNFNLGNRFHANNTMINNNNFQMNNFNNQNLSFSMKNTNSNQNYMEKAKDEEK